MRVLTPVKSYFYDFTATEAVQAVPLGTLGVIRAFSAVPNGDNDQKGTANVAFRDGDDSSSDIVITYHVPYFGAYGTSESRVLRAPLFVVPIPGIGVRFSNGLNVTFTLTSLDLDTSLQVFYT